MREGNALLQGLASCGHCGRHLRTHYRGRNSAPGYHCAGEHLVEDRGSYCLNVGGVQIDVGVAQLEVGVHSLALTAPTAAGTWTSIGPNPSVAGQNYWKTVSTGWSASPTHKYIRQTRVDLSYEFNLFGNKQTILLGRTDQTVTQNTRNTTQASPTVYRAFNDLSPINYAGEVIRPVNDGYFAEWNTGHYGMLQSRWWRDRVVLIAGFRNDRYMVRDLQYDFTKADAAQPDTNVNNWVRSPSFNLSQANSAPGAVPKVNGYRFGGNTQREDGPTVALSFALTKDINLYAATATGVFPNTGQRDGNGDEVGDGAKSGGEFHGLGYFLIGHICTGQF